MWSFELDRVAGSGPRDLLIIMPTREYRHAAHRLVRLLSDVQATGTTGDIVQRFISVVCGQRRSADTRDGMQRQLAVEVGRVSLVLMNRAFDSTHGRAPT